MERAGFIALVACLAGCGGPERPPPVRPVAAQHGGPAPGAARPLEIRTDAGSDTDAAAQPTAIAPTDGSAAQVPAATADASASPPPSAPAAEYDYSHLYDPLGPSMVRSVVAPPAADLPRQIAFGRYMNARFAFALDVPRFMTPDPPPGNGDGQVFRYGDEVEIRAYGSHRLPNVPRPAAADPQHRAYPDVRAVTTVTTELEKIVFRKLIDADGLEVVAMVTIAPGSLPYFKPIAIRALNSLRITTEGMYDRPKRQSQPYSPRPIP